MYKRDILALQASTCMEVFPPMSIPEVATHASQDLLVEAARKEALKAYRCRTEKSRFTRNVHHHRPEGKLPPAERCMLSLRIFTSKTVLEMRKMWWHEKLRMQKGNWFPIDLLNAEKSRDNVLKTSFRNMQSDTGSVVCSPVDQVILDLMCKDVPAKTLEVHIESLFGRHYNWCGTVQKVDSLEHVFSAYCNNV